MSQPKSKTRKSKIDDITIEYDLSKGVRPHFAERFPKGAEITVRGSNGRSTKKEMTRKSVVVLDSDVSQVFPDTDSVNSALRHLIAAVPDKKRKAG